MQSLLSYSCESQWWSVFPADSGEEMGCHVLLIQLSLCASSCLLISFAAGAPGGFDRASLYVQELIRALVQQKGVLP